MELSREQIWAPLRIRAFRRLFIGQALSDFANWIDFVALSALIVYTWGYGSMAIALLSVCIGVPWVVVGPLMSVRAGRLSGKKVLVVCDCLRAVIVLGMVWAPSLPVLLLLVFLKMCVSAVFDPVRQTAVKRLVEPGAMAQASSLSQMSVNLTKIIGPMAGGALIGWIGEWTPFLIGAVLYAVSASVLSGMPEWTNKDETIIKEKSSLREAWTHIARRPVLKAAIVYAAIIFFLIFLYDGLFVMLTKEAGMNEAHFGLLIGAVGAGSVAGALAAGQWSGWKHKPLTHMISAGFVSGILIAVAGLGPAGWLPNTLWLWIPLCIMLGFCGAQSATPFGYILQTESTDDTIGPISALSNSLQTVSMLIAPVLGALAAAWVGTGWVFIFAGAAMVCLAAVYRLAVVGVKERGKETPVSVS
ncbi:MFS transporter [Paenibacillus alkalitolerans]|uniref:MFS transporter n=1 Tax=Paenibacillus alkalitolerans TaxID=2799335 RepID=UPI0018F2A957|nr:MFS transporter [Paenibacillus alkalitolerans]